MWMYVRGCRWRLIWARPHADADGLCVYDDKTIYVDPDLTHNDLLETLIHEHLHALLPDLNEDAITVCARDLSRCLIDSELL